MVKTVFNPVIGDNLPFSQAANQASEGVTLYTPYTKISVPPGESIEYAIDVINNSKELKNAEITVAGMPSGWNYSLKSGGWTIGQIAILPGERKNFSLKVEIPLKVNKGNYRFKVLAGSADALPLLSIYPNREHLRPNLRRVSQICRGT